MNAQKGAVATRPYLYKATGTDGAIKDIDATKRTVTGYLSIFGNKDSHGDIIQAGAFKKTLSERGPDSAKPRLVYLRNHMTDAILGKFTTLVEDGKGLYFEALISDTALGRDTLTLIQDQVIKENSIGYQTITEKFDAQQSVNFLSEVKLWEGSAVTWGSNDLAQMDGVKSAQEIADTYLNELARIKAVLRNETITDETGYMLEIWVKQMQTRAIELIESAAKDTKKEVASSAPENVVSDSTLNILTLGLESYAKGVHIDTDTLIQLLQD